MPATTARRPHRSFWILIGFTLILALYVAALPVLFMLVTGDFPGASSFYGLQEDDPLVDALLTLSQRH